MKHIAYIIVLLICGTTMAQEKPTELKEETEVKTVTYKDGDTTKEKKVKVVTRETSNVNLDKNDVDKINQNRISATKKIEKMIMIDDDADTEYDFLTKETYFLNSDKNYKFTPSDIGFDMAFDNENNKFVTIGKAWSTQNTGSYIIKGEIYNGIGYFNKEGNFIIEYYDEDLKKLNSVIFEENKDNLNL